MDVIRACQKENIVVDSILIGSRARNPDLRAISYVCSGYCFWPDDLSNALKLLELEVWA